MLSFAPGSALGLHQRPGRPQERFPGERYRSCWVRVPWHSWSWGSSCTWVYHMALHDIQCIRAPGITVRKQRSGQENSLFSPFEKWLGLRGGRPPIQHSPGRLSSSSPDSVSLLGPASSLDGRFPGSVCCCTLTTPPGLLEAQSGPSPVLTGQACQMALHSVRF